MDFWQQYVPFPLRLRDTDHERDHIAIWVSFVRGELRELWRARGIFGKWHYCIGVRRSGVTRIMELVGHEIFDVAR
jgi:hypothetical protein